MISLFHLCLISSFDSQSDIATRFWTRSELFSSAFLALTKLANFCSLTNFVRLILVSFGRRVNFRNILTCGWRTGIAGERYSRAKAWWCGHPCEVAQMSSSSPVWWHQHEDKLQHFNIWAPMGATQNEIKRSCFLNRKGPHSAASAVCYRDGEQDGLACEGLGPCKETWGLGTCRGVSCKHPRCQGVLWGACYGAVTHGAVCVTAGQKDVASAGAGWALHPAAAHIRVSRQKAIYQPVVLTFSWPVWSRANCPGQNKKSERMKGGRRLQPSCLQGEAVKWHLREVLSLSHCGAACAHSGFQCLKICARGSWLLHFCQLPPLRQNLTSCFSFPLICLLLPPLFPCPHDSHKKIMETIWE